MHHPVEYGVGGGGVCFQTVVPVGDGDLRGYDCRLAAVAVLDLMFRAFATFGLIYDLKLPKPTEENSADTPKKVGIKAKIIFFINIFVHLPNLALIFPIVFMFSPKLAFVYMLICLAMMVLYVPLVGFAWLKRIVRI